MLQRALTVLLLLAVASARAQTSTPANTPPVMSQSEPMVMSARTLIQAIQEHGTSGTSIEPATTPVPMLMTDRSAWRLMLHANVFIANTQQQANSPRNRDAFFSTNWIMPMAERNFGANGRGGELTLRTMFSLEPATVPDRNYPELFQQGETAYGNPIVDGQHPHDFFMEVAALYDLPLSPHTLLSFYGAPIGDPAIGPTAYPHRQSASEDPIAALGHHQQDSTHIAFNVLTGGLTYRIARIEFSGFHGGEPDEHRWAFQPSPNGHAIDSYSTRLTISPTPDLTGQYSIAHITSPEALYPGENQQRQTASIMYHHTFHSRTAPTPTMSMPGMNRNSTQQGSAAHAPLPMLMVPDPRTDLATTFLWGRARSLTDNSKENSYLAEALLRFASTNYIWTRVENAGRSNELLLTPGTPLPPNFVETPIGHVAAYTFGYDHDLPFGHHILIAPGAQLTIYRTPEALRPTYGNTPTAETIFVRFRLR
ncbi:hypothetical protein [Granulicella sp. L46]|uniref:hypothetical protein n=1 Tax=Granulicella sp. L46 TaxID=1641865 RepID=UPI001C202FB8|nr:hypothetical protein [Granulicella sp. L46]